MKKSEIVKQQHYAATDGTASYRRYLGGAVRVEVLELGVRRGYYQRTSDWHGREVEKNDGVRVRFVEDGRESFASSGKLAYDNGSCLKGEIGVISARDLWMAWTDYEALAEEANVKAMAKKERLADQRSRAAAVVEAFGRGEPHVGEGVIGRPQVHLDLADAEKLAAIVVAARKVAETGDATTEFQDALAELERAVDDEVPVALGDEEGEPVS